MDTTSVEKIREYLSSAFKNGHKNFVKYAADLMQLHSKKNHDYAQGGDPLGNFKRVGAILELYPGFPYTSPEGIAMIYALKQVDAEMQAMASNGTFKCEGYMGRTTDQAVYALLRQCIRADKAEGPVVHVVK